MDRKTAAKLQVKIHLMKLRMQKEEIKDVTTEKRMKEFVEHCRPTMKEGRVSRAELKLETFRLATKTK